MTGPTIVFWTLLALAFFGILARVTRIPYPIVMLAGGALVALIPNIPPIHLPPDVVFFVLLPPLLFSGGWTTDVRSFKHYLEPILLLALGLVAFTTVTVAIFAHAFIGLSIGTAFVLGAILSPPDAIATEAIGESVPFPYGLATILSGESLINDATALVIYNFAVAAVMTGAFSLAHATLDFAYVTIAGIAIGLAVAEGASRLQVALRKRGFVDDVSATIITLVTPFLVYLPAEAVHASGVLAVVAASIALSRRSGVMFDGEMRLVAGSAWGVAVFALNGIAFLAIGLQLDAVIAGLAAYKPATLAFYAIATSAIVIGSRFAWIYISIYTRKAFGRLAGFDNPKVTWRGMFVMSWAGMRGIVTLACALALPATMPSGGGFPDRDLIVFLAFTTIVVTLVGQGLTLPIIMRRLDVVEDDGDVRAQIGRARLRVAQAARARLRELESGFTSQAEWTIAGRLIATLDQRIEHFGDGVTPTLGPENVTILERDREIQRELSTSGREALAEMVRAGDITDRVYRDLQWEIDLLDVHLG
jgi:CPA1 family monovalent cation:H+ antiporter